MDQKDLNDFKNVDLEHYIPYIGKHLSGWKDVKTENDAVIFRLSGLSNITCMVKAKSKSVSPRFVIFRVFNNELCDSEVESAVFECLSDQLLGPVCYYFNKDYRIEQSFDAKPITIFEMRNPVYMQQILKKTFKLNFNIKLKEKLLELQGPTAETQIEILKNDWIPKLQHKWQHLRESLTVDEYIGTMDLVKKEYLGEDNSEYIDALYDGMVTNREDLVVSHNDIQECNVLAMRNNATDIAIIDYEYTSLGVKEHDLANLF
jgi:thiamine kinase-like enzyme